jgi:hypothetical protein
VILDVWQLIAFCITSCIVLRPIEIIEHLTLFSVRFYAVSSGEERSEASRTIEISDLYNFLSPPQKSQNDSKSIHPLTGLLGQPVSGCIVIFSPIGRPVLQQFMEDILKSDSSLKAAHKD